MRIAAALSGLLICLCFSGAAQVSDFAGTDFARSDSVAALYNDYSLKDLKGLADKLTIPFTTEQEKFRAIFKWVCNNVEVDYDLVLMHQQRRHKLRGEKLTKWNKVFNRKVFDVLVREHKTVCTGFAYLVRELSFHAGLTCHVVNGFANPRGVTYGSESLINHSWNEVRLNGAWYVCDATWSSGIYDRSQDRFVRKFNETWFLQERQAFDVQHKRLDR